MIDYRTEDVRLTVEELTGGEGVHRVVDVAFGQNLATSQDVLRVNGFLATYASDAVPEPTLPFYPLLLKGITLRFCLVYVLPARALQAAIEAITACLEAGVLHHRIGGSFTLDQIADAHRAVESGRLVGNAGLDVGEGRPIGG